MSHGSNLIRLKARKLLGFEISHISNVAQTHQLMKVKVECDHKDCTGFRSGYAYKLCVLMHQVHIGRSPAYLTDMMTATADLPGRERLRSANSF